MIFTRKTCNVLTKHGEITVVEGDIGYIYIYRGIYIYIYLGGYIYIYIFRGIYIYIYIYIYTILLYFHVLLRTLIKTERILDKTPNFAKVTIIIWTSYSKNFNVLGYFVFELLELKVRSTFMWLLTTVLVRGLPLCLRFFSKSWKYMVVEFLHKHKISAIHDFFSRVSLPFWKRPKMRKFFFVKISAFLAECRW